MHHDSQRPLRCNLRANAHCVSSSIIKVIVARGLEPLMASASMKGPSHLNIFFSFIKRPRGHDRIWKFVWLTLRAGSNIWSCSSPSPIFNGICLHEAYALWHYHYGHYGNQSYSMYLIFLWTVLHLQGQILPVIKTVNTNLLNVVCQLRCCLTLAVSHKRGKHGHCLCFKFFT